jgi:hypothetical protein
MMKEMGIKICKFLDSNLFLNIHIYLISTKESSRKNSPKLSITARL